VLAKGFLHLLALVEHHIFDGIGLFLEQQTHVERDHQQAFESSADKQYTMKHRWAHLPC
jgi:hypothetical protein